MKTNKLRKTLADGWTKVLTITPLLLCSVSLCAGDTAKKPAAAPAKAAPAARAPAGAAGKAASPAASHGPTTAGAGATTAGATTSGKGPTTAGRPAAGGAGAAAAGRPGAGGAGAAAAGRPGAGGAGAGAAGRPAAGESRAAGAHVTPGTRAVPVRGGGEAHVDSRGRVTDLHRGGMDVHRGASGVRNVRVEREDHSRVFVGRGGHGYVQGRYMYGGHEFGHRTYYEHGRAYDRFYRRYDYHGVYLEGYAPVRYYAPAYYGWAYAPWAAPAPYAWGWVGNPWALYYGAYFTPYPVYASPAFWLTDYMISASLAAAYQAQLDAANGGPPPAFAAPPTPLTPEVKQLISAEVQRQIALENAEAQQVAKNTEPDPASSGIVRMLTDNASHVFVAGADVDVIDARGQQCALSHGDVIQLNPPNPPLAPDAINASLVVLASKPQECMRGQPVSVQLADLQDMQNHMREQIDTGLSEMQSAKGLPAIPQSARAMPTPAPFAALAPPPDPTAATQIAQQVQEADKAEKDVTSDAQVGSAAVAAPVAAPPAPPKEPVKVGQTVDQVDASLGKPTQVFDIGGKKIYTYKDLGVKITFKDGKVVDVQ